MTIYNSIQVLSKLARQRLAELAKSRVQQGKQGKATWQGFDKSGKGVVDQDGTTKTVRTVGNVSLSKGSTVFVDEKSTAEFTNRRRPKTTPPVAKPKVEAPRQATKKSPAILPEDGSTTIKWTLTQSGNSAPYGWKLSNEDLTIRYDVEDSANCGGRNSNVQRGTATALIKSDLEGYISLNVTGSGEVQDPGYDILTVTLNSTTIVDGHAPGGGRGCGSGPSVITYRGPNKFKILEGENTLKLSFDTRDGRYHNNAFYEVIISSEDLTFEREEEV